MFIKCLYLFLNWSVYNLFMVSSQEILILAARVKRGSNRLKVFLCLENGMVPSEIVRRIYKKPSTANFNIVSRALRELNELGLVDVINPEAKTGRVYVLTTLGKKVKAQCKYSNNQTN